MLLGIDTVWSWQGGGPQIQDSEVEQTGALVAGSSSQAQTGSPSTFALQNRRQDQFSGARRDDIVTNY